MYNSFFKEALKTYRGKEAKELLYNEIPKMDIKKAIFVNDFGRATLDIIEVTTQTNYPFIMVYSKDGSNIRISLDVKQIEYGDDKCVLIYNSDDSITLHFSKK